MASLFKPKTLAMAKLAKLPQYQHPALLSLQFKKPIRIQRQQLAGQLEFGEGMYHNLNYQALTKTLKDSRKSHQQSTSIDARSQVSRSQLNAWEKYVSEGARNIPKAKKIDDKKKDQLYQAFIVVKERTQDKVSCHRIPHLHNEYAKGFKWDIEVHPRILLQIVHPHFGYMTNFNKKLSMQQLIQFYQRMLLASQERYLGQTLHSDEISAYNFWRLYTDQASLKLGDFCHLLQHFKFQTSPQTFQKQFSYTLSRNKGELIKVAKAEQVLRFDLFRNIFLDLGL